MARIGVVNVGFYSHAAAVARLGVLLCRQGHEVIAWGPGRFCEQIETAGGYHEIFPELAADPAASTSLKLAAELADAAERCTEGLIERLFDHDLDLVVHDVMMPWARIAGDFLGLPRLALYPIFPGSFGRNGDAHPRAPDLDLEAAETRLAAIRLSIARRWHVELGNWMDVLFNPGYATLVPTTAKLARNELQSGWYYIGPLMDPAPRPEPRRGRPLVYMSLGTSFNDRAEVFRAVADALAEEPVDVIMSTGGGRVSASDLAPLPHNIELRDFVPAREVLAQASLHITHGGISSVHESLLAGVPMLCLPQAVDQFRMSARLQRLGAGKTVSEDPADIREAVRLMLADERMHRRSHELGRQLAAYDTSGRVAALVERVLAEAGGATL